MVDNLSGLQRKNNINFNCEYLGSYYAKKRKKLYFSVNILKSSCMYTEQSVAVHLDSSLTFKPSE